MSTSLKFVLHLSNALHRDEKHGKVAPMRNRDIRFQGFERADIARAVGLLSRLPVRVDPDSAQSRGARASWAWPIAGGLFGAIGAAVATISLWLGLGPVISAAFALATLTVITGAMHEDGLADCADGFWGAWDRARRLEIMKDSHIGAYGVIALILSFLLRWSALAALCTEGYVWTSLIAAGALSRAPMVLLMHQLPNARGSGLSQGVGRPTLTAVQGALATGFLIGFLTTGFQIIPLIIVVGVATVAAAAIAKSKIGGQTGDVLGASQQVTDSAALITLVALNS
jgi:adenosylcobinamide-GDP ribazoletransferase